MSLKIYSLSGEKLYELGLEIGRQANLRPDIMHRIMVGVRDGLEHSDSSPTSLNGDLFWGLWRHWYYKVKGGNMQEHPTIPFTPLMQLSGTGNQKK